MALSAALEVEELERCYNQDPEDHHKPCHDESTPLDEVGLKAQHVCKTPSSGQHSTAQQAVKRGEQQSG